jgi:hypothetical protein
MRPAPPRQSSDRGDRTPGAGAVRLAKHHCQGNAPPQGLGRARIRLGLRTSPHYPAHTTPLTHNHTPTQTNTHTAMLTARRPGVLYRSALSNNARSSAGAVWGALAPTSPSAHRQSGGPLLMATRVRSPGGPSQTAPWRPQTNSSGAPTQHNAARYAQGSAPLLTLSHRPSLHP